MQIEILPLNKREREREKGRTCVCERELAKSGGEKERKETKREIVCLGESMKNVSERR